MSQSLRSIEQKKGRDALIDAIERRLISGTRGLGWYAALDALKHLPADVARRLRKLAE